MKAGKIYKHINCLDVQMHVLKVSYRGPKYYKLRVMWWNPIYDIYCFPTPETVKVNRNEFGNWKEIT